MEIFEEEGRAVFDGAVTVIQGDTILRTSKLIIYYAKNNKENSSIATGGADIERLQASGGVNIQRGKQTATGETGTYDMKTEILILSGKQVTLSEDGNVATGCKFTMTHLNGVAKEIRRMRRHIASDSFDKSTQQQLSEWLVVLF
ncbi:MAG: LptA/OstA family protein [Ahrensia sp.]|nr:LptA/OstA family protein [Ahrensia sp.]